MTLSLIYFNPCYDLLWKLVHLCAAFFRVCVIYMLVYISIRQARSYELESFKTW